MRSLGNTGLYVSRLALGTMTWGGATDEYDAHDQLRTFLDAGGTFVDTADVYGHGMSEGILGRVLAELGVRDQVVLATKAVSVRPDPRRFNASRAHLLTALDRSLARLGVDHVDLWQLHAWDPLTPLDETLGAVDAAVRSGRVRYAGISNYSGWQLARAATVQSERRGSAPLVSAQMEYSLLQRGIEREVLPAAHEFGIGILPWSPLGRGVLTGKYRAGIPAGSRATTEEYGAFVEEFLTPTHARIIDAVVTAANGLNSTPLEVALAWVRDRPGVVAPIVGARTTAQLAAALTSEELVLPAEITSALDEVSAPHRGYPEFGWNQRGEQ